MARGLKFTHVVVSLFTAVLLELGWPGGRLPAPGALVYHMLDCMELRIALDTASALAVAAAGIAEGVGDPDQRRDDEPTDDEWVDDYDLWASTAAAAEHGAILI